MVKSHYLRCLQCFPTQENLTTKILNPNVTSFVIQFSLSSSTPSKTEQKHLYSTLQLSKSCHDWQNRVTIDAYYPKYDQLYLENVENMPKIVYDSSKSCHNWTPENTKLTACQIVSCHLNCVTIWYFHTFTIWRQFQQYMTKIVFVEILKSIYGWPSNLFQSRFNLCVGALSIISQNPFRYHS